jgi:hypothetical protein
MAAAAAAPSLGELGKGGLEGRPSVEASRPDGDSIGADDEDQPIAPDQFDEKYETTRKEIWSYYS